MSEHGPAELPTSAYHVILRWPQRRLGLALPAGVYGELVGDAQAVPIPHAPSWIAGLIAAEGKPVPVYSLDDPWSAADPAKRQLMLVRGAPRLFALRTTAEPAIDALTPLTAEAEHPDLPETLAGSAGSWNRMHTYDELAVSWDPFLWIRRMNGLEAAPQPTEDRS